MFMRRFQSVGRQFLFGSAGLLLGWTGTGMVAAQPAGQPSAASSAAPVQRNYLNKNVIQLPIQITEQSRSLIQEIQLFAKDQPGAVWTMRDKVTASAKSFTYEVPKDGEYWFAMVTIDKQGRGYPSDLRNEAPGLIVVIDTQKPAIEVTNLGSTVEGHWVQCEVRDANLDATRTQLAYQGGDRKFRTLESIANRPGVFCIPTQAVYTGLVRVSAEDLAGNTAQQEVNLSQLPVTKAAALSGPQMPPPLPSKKPMGTEPGTLPTFPKSTPEVNLEPVKNDQKPTTNSGRPDGSEGPHGPLWQQVDHKTESPRPVGPILPVAQETLKRQFVNNTKVFLDYQIENGGQAGAGKVEVWITRDRAKSWQKLSADAQRNNQIEIQFPGEGIFGVTLVATNAKGIAGAAPNAGDAPDWWVEVDTTTPVVHLTKAESITEAGKTTVHLAWTALDKNFSDAPVELFYSTSPQGPWQSIAKGLKADGQHRWSPPTEAGAKAYLRLVARDSAGNESNTTTKDAVALEELVRPRAVIRGISTPAQIAPPTVPTPPVLQIVQPPKR